MKHLSFRAAVLVTAFCSSASILAAQQATCPGLPQPEPPKMEDCPSGWREALKGLVGAGCNAGNERRKAGYERLMRGFTSGLDYNSGEGYFLSGLDSAERIVTVDSLRGCRGESINLEFTPGNVTYFEYDLTSPSNVTVSASKYGTWSGDRILGESITLPETGYYILKTRTTAPAKYLEHKKRDGTIERELIYPRKFHIGFRSDANVKALAAGDKVDATINAKQPFIRRVAVRGGTKVRFRFASQGTGDFLVIVRRESGEELYRNPAATSFYESKAITPRTDETFRVEVRPWTVSQSVGVQFSVIDDKATGEPVTSTSRVAGAFKLPAHFDGATNAGVSTSETVRFLYQAAGPEELTLTVKPSQLAGLAVRARAYNQETEEVILKSPALSATTALPLSITSAGTWVIELTPLAATDLDESGEAKYGIELAPRSASPRRGRGAKRAATAP